MNTEKKHKKDKEIALELEYQIKDVKHQLTEQLKCLDSRLENHFAMSAELAEFYQRRAEVEMEYSKNLDKIVRQILTKHKAERQKRESWQNYSTFKLWQTLLEVTSKQSRCHATFSESLNNIVAGKFAQMREDMSSIYRKCYGIATSLHAELHKSMTELHSFLKTYQQYHGESVLLQSKLMRAETQKSKVEQDNKKGTLSKKLLNFDKKTEKHRQKVQEGNLKALKSRNEYLLSIDSTNAALRKYFIDDLPDLINAMDYSYHISMGQVVMNAVELEETVNKLNNENLTTVASKAKDLNQISDRQVFLQLHHQIFSLPKRFDFLAHRGDGVSEVQAPSQLRDEMVSRVQTIMERLHALKLENDELWKTLETTDNSMVCKLTTPTIDLASVFQMEKSISRMNIGDPEKMQRERAETQNFYFNKFKNFELNSNLAARLQAKCLTLEKVLAISKTGLHRSVTLTNRQLKRKTLGKFALEGRPKLFGGSIREYVNATGQEIPLVIRSCTKIINLYGMHHQGVFRIPGLQHEINEYKNMFEKGEEPILVKVETRDINSVAGVLKLYFRELSEPLFPLQLFDELVACSKYNVEDPEELRKCIERLQELLLPLPRAILVVIRYLFAFLNHLTEYSDENMMDAHNLSVCFGPTLIPVPPDHDPVNHQNQINELVRILIVYQERIFPNDGGMVYEKFIIDEENDLEESVDTLLEGAGGENSEDDVESHLEAVALHDFQGRSDQELSLKKGETLKLFKKVSSDWWEGATNEQTGLIPHKHIAISSRRRITGSIDGEDKLFVSTESLPSRSSSVTATIHSSTAPAGDNFDRSISQPNICESPKGRREVKEGQPKDYKNDSVLSSTSTITFSESSFSNLSDEHRASVDSGRKSSSTSNKEDSREQKKPVRLDPVGKVGEGRRTCTLDRKVESFSPLIPVLEIMEPLEIVLEAKDQIPPRGSDSRVESNMGITRGQGGSMPTSPHSDATEKRTMEFQDLKALRVPANVRSLSSSSDPFFPNISTTNESPEKSPGRLGGSMADSYFSFSLLPMESKPPAAAETLSTSGIGSSSPSGLKSDRAELTPDVFVNTSDLDRGDVRLTIEEEEISIRETEIMDDDFAPLESAEVSIPLHVSETDINQRQESSLDHSPMENFPPPPDELLLGFEKSFEPLPSQGPEVKRGEGDRVDLPTLSIPSFLVYMESRQKQGDLKQGQETTTSSSKLYLQDNRPPTQQQLNSQYMEASRSIASASLNGSSSSGTKTFDIHRPPSRSGTKSLGTLENSEGPDPKMLSNINIVSTPQVPGCSSSDPSSSLLRNSSSRPQGVSGLRTSPRLSALSMNLPTLSIYTTLAPNVSSASAILASGHSQVEAASPYLPKDFSSPKLRDGPTPSPPTLQGDSNSPGASSDKGKNKPPPTLKKPGTRI